MKTNLTFLRKNIVAALSIVAMMSAPLKIYASGQLSISPVRIDFGTSLKSATITIQNPTDQAVQIQVRGKEWQQQQGKDILSDSKDLVVAPKFFNLPAHGRQIIRVGLIKPITTNEELTYRLLIDEIPVKTEANNKIQLALSVSLPIIVNGVETGKDHLTWHHDKTKMNGKDYLRITAKNSGEHFTRVFNISDANQKLHFKPEVESAGYILKNNTLSWITPYTDSLPKTIKLQIKTNNGNSETESVMQ